MELEIIGRILLGVLIAFAGLNHFMKMSQMASMAKQNKIPMPKFSVFITGVALLASGLGIATWTEPVASLWILAVFLILAAFMMHRFWSMEGEAKHSNMIFFMSNMNLAGACFIILSFMS